jgi:hypothetical protein
VFIRTGEPQRIPQGRALDKLVNSLVVARKFHANRQIRAAIQEKFGYRQPPVTKLRDGMEDWSLSTDTGRVESRTSVDIRSAIQ